MNERIINLKKELQELDDHELFYVYGFVQGVLER